ncbi:MAG: sensor domain-containing diguanylate cyclase/phosphohydrolase, partial [Bacillota bacterium]
MGINYMSNKTTEYNSGLINLNNFMLEQTEINEYESLVKSIVTQLGILLNPVITVYSEYNTDSKVLFIKKINANQKVLNLVLEIADENILSTVTPVTDDMYKKMTVDRLEILSSLHEASGGTISESVSNAIGKALNMNCCLAFSFMVEGQLFGTALIALKGKPELFIIELLKTYAHFTSISLRRVLAEEALKKSEQELKTITENMTDLVSMTDAEGRFIYVSGSYYKLLGYDKDELLGKTLFKIVFEEDLPEVSARFQKAVVSGKNDSVDYRAVKKDGSIIWLEKKSNLLFDSEGLVSGIIFSTRDITERKVFEEALRESEQIYRNIVDNMTDVVWIFDMNCTVTYVSPSVERMLGETVEEHLQKTMEQKYPPQSLEYLFKVFQEEIDKEKDPLADKNRTRVLELEHYKADGTTIWLSMHISALKDNRGNITGFQGVARNITDQKKTEEYIRYISFHDQLTGLNNRHYFEHCRKELETIPVISVIVTDINGLKLVNDTYGHEYGDQLIKEYANILKQSFKQGDLIFRWGGDEFIIVLKNTEEARSWELYNRLVKHCGNTYVKDIPLSISVGISSKLKGENIEKALSEAENMMYNNKIKESKSSKNLIIKTILQALSDISHETKDHTERMSVICQKFGKYLNLSPSELSRLNALIMLHDIGLINIDRDTLLKETSLTNGEWQKIKKHPEFGYHITRSTEEFASVAEDILAHHERWDGTGYPQGLKGENIPYLARILN